MAAIANVYAERTTTLSHTGDLLWQDVVTLPAASFVDNGVYFIIVWGDFFSDDNDNASAEVRVVHGSTPTVFPGSLHIFESSGGINAVDKHLYGPFVDEFTQPATAEDVILQMRVNLNTVTIEAGTCSAVAIRRDTDLTENTDYKYAENTNTTEHTTTMAARASITWTPANNNHDWLVICFQQTIIDSVAVNYEVQIDRDSGTETAGFFAKEGEDTGDQLVYGTFWPFTLSNSSHTLALHSRDDATGINDHAFSAILALRLDASEDHTIFTNTGTIDAFGDDVYGEIGAMDITPQTAGDILLLARSSTKEIGTGDESVIRIQIGGSDVIGLRGSDSGNGPWSSRNFDPTDLSPMFIMARENVAASAQDVDIDGKMHEGLTGEQDMRDRAGVVFSMELAGAAATSLFPPARQNTLVRM